MSGAVVSRAEAQTMRLACIYALLDCSEVIQVQHLKAALALWKYAERSAQVIFGNLLGDRNVDKAKRWLKERGSLTLTELYNLFGRNLPKAEIDRVVKVLCEGGFATLSQEGSTIIIRCTNWTN